LVDVLIFPLKMPRCWPREFCL